MKTRLAFFYKPNSLTINGWKERLTTPVDKHNRPCGRISHKQIKEEGWCYLGTFEVEGNRVAAVWKDAK